MSAPLSRPWLSAAPCCHTSLCEPGPKIPNLLREDSHMPRLCLTKRNAKIFASSMLAVGVLLLCTLPLAAQDNASPETTVRQAVGFAVSPPVSELAKLPQAPQYGFHEALPVRRIPKPDL